jgi:hypothetical protein
MILQAGDQLVYRRKHKFWFFLGMNLEGQPGPRRPLKEFLKFAQRVSPISYASASCDKMYW